MKLTNILSIVLIYLGICALKIVRGNTPSCSHTISSTPREVPRSGSSWSPAQGQGQPGGQTEVINGVIESYNYPFDYQHNLTCHYNIHVPGGSTTHQIICFKFHRFDLEHTTPFCSFDYLRFENTKYCGSGGWQFGERINSRSDVWYENFCWQVKHEYFIVEFHSDDSYTGRGFYATFTVTEGELGEPQGISHLLGQAPCSSTEWTCYNRRCINATLVCNAINDCGDNSDESYTHARCGEQNLLTCDFSTQGQGDGYCGFVQESGQWFRTNQQTTPTGPAGDHTNSTYGYYVYVDSPLTSSYLSSPEITLSSNSSYHCLSFWYYVYGAAQQQGISTTPSDAGRGAGGGSDAPVQAAHVLVYIMRTQRYQRPEWARITGHTHRWVHGQITIHNTNSIQVVFGAEFANSFSGLAIDDISLLPGQCTSDDISCNFESSTCGWTSVTSSGGSDIAGSSAPSGSGAGTTRSGLAVDLQWQIRNSNTGPGPHNDHSSLDRGGAYLYLNSQQLISSQQPTNQDTNYRALFMSRMLMYSDEPMGSRCFSLWYHMSGHAPESAALRVRVGRDSGGATTEGPAAGDTEIVWAQNAEIREQWRYLAVDISTITPYRIILEGLVHPQQNAGLAVDEIRLDNEPCPNPVAGTCGGAGAGSSSAQYMCMTGMCVDGDVVCDNRPQCDDGSDEGWRAACAALPPTSPPPDEPCPPLTHFLCGSGGTSGGGAQGATGKCVIRSWVCDGFTDCEDASDEAHCTTTSAPSTTPSPTPTPSTTPSLPTRSTAASRPNTCGTQYQCVSNGECLDKQYMCDGIPHCQRGEDEQNCVYHGSSSTVAYLCASDQFTCDNGVTCIARNMLCDHKVDCVDGSDEDSAIAGCQVGAIKSSPSLSAGTIIGIVIASILFIVIIIVINIIVIIRLRKRRRKPSSLYSTGAPASHYGAHNGLGAAYSGPGATYSGPGVTPISTISTTAELELSRSFQGQMEIDSEGDMSPPSMLTPPPYTIHPSSLAHNHNTTSLGGSGAVPLGAVGLGGSTPPISLPIGGSDEPPPPYDTNWKPEHQQHGSGAVDSSHMHPGTSRRGDSSHRSLPTTSRTRHAQPRHAPQRSHDLPNTATARGHRSVGISPVPHNGHISPYGYDGRTDGRRHSGRGSGYGARPTISTNPLVRGNASTATMGASPHVGANGGQHGGQTNNSSNQSNRPISPLRILTTLTSRSPATTSLLMTPQHHHSRSPHSIGAAGGQTAHERSLYGDSTDNSQEPIYAELNDFSSPDVSHDTGVSSNDSSEQHIYAHVNDDEPRLLFLTGSSTNV